MPITPDPAGTKPWYTGYANLHNFINTLESEILAARQGKVNLLANILLYATKSYVETQIATGGVNVSTFARPHDIITANNTSDAFDSESNAPLEIFKHNYYAGGLV